MPESETDDTDAQQIKREDLSLKTSDKGPVLEIGDSLTVTLETFVKTGDATDFDSLSDEFSTDVDCDGDNGCWWTVWNESDLDRSVTIQPVVEPDTGGVSDE